MTDLRELYSRNRGRAALSPLRLSLEPEKEASADPPAAQRFGATYQELKHELHQRILQRVDLAAVEPEEEEAALRDAAAAVVEEALDELPLSREERERLLEDLVAEAVGLGPLGVLFEDAAVSDILVNGPHEVFVEQFGRLRRTSVRFHDEAHLINLIQRIVGRVGRHVDQASPMVDARLPDGSRVNVVLPPLSLSGPILSIRRFGHRRLQPEDLVRLGTVPAQLMELLRMAVWGQQNVCISGGTGSGKTTLLNTLSSFVDDSERIVTVENAAELRLQQEHVVRLEERPASLEGLGAVPIRDLVVNALRMRPDRIIVGEVRAGEAFDMLQAMSTGHDGSMTTVHANSARDALIRLEAMVLMAGFDLPARAIRQMMVSALDLLVHVDRLRDGSRRVMSVAEVVGIEGETPLIQDIFVFQTDRVTPKRVEGRHVATGVVPRFVEACELHGIEIDRSVFERGRAL